VDEYWHGDACPRYVEFATELIVGGVGNPVNANTSLVRSAFRPSDDATILPFLIPANAFMSVELEHLSFILRDTRIHTPSLTNSIALMADKARAISLGIANGIKENAIFHHPIFSHVYAYEVDGYGGRIFMDDANLPSLLSLPLLGFVDKKDPVYQATREMVLSTFGNPFYLTGRQFHGIGGPHIGVRHAWPMSLLVQIMTSDDDVEIMELLDLLKTSTAGLGLMHESGTSTLFLTLMESECSEGGRVYQALVCMGEWIVWGDDTGLDCTETGVDFGEGI
jgi:uncharacterized protein